MADLRKLRWKTAALLNRLPWFCWADLVSWAIDGKSQPVNEIAARAKECRSQGKISACWCAKFCTAEFRSTNIDQRQ
jgi:hypothetical protein